MVLYKAGELFQASVAQIAFKFESTDLTCKSLNQATGSILLET